MGKNAGETELNRKGGTTRDSFQHEIPGLEYLAFLNRTLNLREAGYNGKRRTIRLISMGNCRRYWTQQGKRDNQRLIPTGNPRFTIFGLSQQEKFKVSWIQEEKKDNQDSFWWEISAENLFHISMGNCRSWIQWERENQGLLSTGNYKFSNIKLEVVIYRMIFLKCNHKPESPESTLNF